MPEETKEELGYQLERCFFALSTMMTECRYLMTALDDDAREWPEDADMMLSDLADAIGEADDKSCVIVDQIKRYID